MVGEYSDALVIRHNMEGAARYVSSVVDVPVINAGDGAGQHPTQTLLGFVHHEKSFWKNKRTQCGFNW